MNKQEAVDPIAHNSSVNGVPAENGRLVTGSINDSVARTSATGTGALLLRTSDDRTSDDRALGTTFLERLLERKICRWMLGYLAVAWLVLQLTDVLSDIWSWSVLAQQMVSLVLGLGVFPAVVVAWYHGEQGRQRVCKMEVAVLATLIIAAVLTIRALYGGALA